MDVTETLHTPINADKLIADYKSDNQIVLIGCAALLLDNNNRGMFLRHNSGTYAQADQIGPISETIKYTPERGNGICESFWEVLQRALHEELHKSEDDIEKAQIFVSEDSCIDTGLWEIGRTSEGNVISAIGYGAILRVANPIFLKMEEPTDEIKENFYLPINEFPKLQNLRVGVSGWYQTFEAKIAHLNNSNMVSILQPSILPKTTEDVIFSS